MIEGQKPQVVKPSDTSDKYSGGLLKPGQGEHFEREQARLNRYKGIEAMPRTENLEEKLYGMRDSGQSKIKVKSSCLGLLLLAALVPVAALVLLLAR